MAEVVAPAGTVDEATGREAVDYTVRAFTEQQRQLGVLPDVRRAEDFVRPIVEETIRKQEEAAAQPRPAPAEVSPLDAPAGSKARIDRGLVGEGRTVIKRRLTKKELRARQKAMAPRSEHDKLLLKRLKLLEQYPDWLAALINAATRGDQLAMMSGSMLDRADVARRHAFWAAEMMKVVEASNNVFGDYRNPKAKAAPIVVGPTLAALQSPPEAHAAVA